MRFPLPAELLPSMARDLQQHLHRRGIQEPLFIGIHSGGVWVAQALLEVMGRSEALGTLDVSFYRDDFTQNGLHPQVRPSALPFEIEGQHLVLIDDVLFTGRTTRAVINELFDFGRPASVTLAVLVDRGGRELPIHPAYAAARIALPAAQRLSLVRDEAGRFSFDIRERTA